MIKYLASLSLLLLSVSLLAQNISFEDPVVILEHPRFDNTILNYPFIPFDYNNDGYVDFAGSSFNEQYIYKGKEDGTFEEIILNWSQAPIKIIDWDGDGDDDSVFDGHVRITQDDDEFELLNLGLSLDEKVTDVGDLNNDSFMDFVAINRITFESNEVAYYLNNGDDTFTKTLLGDDKEYDLAVIGDINLDGLPEIVFAGSSVKIANNNGDGTFEINNDILASAQDEILLTDLDTDGDNDLVVLAGIVTHFKNENGEILRSTETDIFDSADIVKAGDFNGDGANDLVSLVIGLYEFDINLMQNDGSGNFDLFSENITSFARPSVIGIPDPEILRNNISVYDYDGDGLEDIIYIDGVTEPNSIMLLRNNTIISSTNNIEPSSDFKIFPNPAEDFIRLGIDTKQYNYYQIYSSIGQLISSGELMSNEIKINDLKNGIYHVILTSKNQANKAASNSFIKL